LGRIYSACAFLQEIGCRRTWDAEGCRGDSGVDCRERSMETTEGRGSAEVDCRGRPTITAFLECERGMPCPSQITEERGKRNATNMVSQFETDCITVQANDRLTTSFAC
jgi:hypothetical protein